MIYLPPPPRWTKRDYCFAAAYLAMILVPWLLIAAVVVGILFAVGVLP